MLKCPICFEMLNNMNNIIKTECGHEFHSSCFLTNVAHNGFNCPCCRKELASTPSSYEDEDMSDDEDEYVSEDEDEYVSEDEDEDNIYPPLDYIIQKLQQKFSKQDLLKIIINSYCIKAIEECLDIDQRFFNDFMKISCDFKTYKIEEKENELMLLEDKEYDENKAKELVNDFETILNTRVY